MRKGEGWRALKWVGTHGLAVGLTMRPCPHGQAQTQTYDSLQVGATWWWGDLDQWTLAEEDALWTLDATSEGPHVLCGCQPDVSEPGMVALHWHQGVHGSGANRSQLFFGSSDSDNASESARQWGLTALGDSLTMGVRLSAGESGSSDALRVECPGAPPLALDGTCHNWGSPFELDGLWQPFDDQDGAFHLEDIQGRSLHVLNHSFHAEAEMICVGIKVTRTASHGQDWAFGWRLQAPPASQAKLQLALDGPQSLRGLVYDAFELDPPEVFLHQAWTPSEPQPPDATPAVAGVQSLVPWDHGFCSNTWTATLPQPVAPGQAARFSHLDDTLVVWRDGSALLVQGDLAFTEVMADPTPAVHAPESTYLELVNLSSHALDPTALWLEDSDEFHGLSWPDGATPRFVPPGACWVVVDDPEQWPLGNEQPIVVKAAGWSGLRDDGESVAIVGAQGELERVTFHEEWWDGTSQDGVSVSVVTPGSCDHPSTWKPDPEGASPGRLAWPVQDTVHHREVDAPLHLRLDDQLQLHLNPDLPWDTRTTPTVHLLNGPIQRAFLAFPNVSDGWTLDNFRVKPGTRLHIHVEETAACHHPWRTLPLDTIWTAHRPAQFGDIRMSEILSEHHPVVDAEFVEWLNVSDDTLAWGDACWPPDHTLVQATLPKFHFASWIPADVLDSPGLWEVQTDLRLTNSAGHVTLDRPDGVEVASSSYSDCAFSRPEDVGQGNSAVWGEFGWRTSDSPWGMSPGWVEPLVDSMPAIEPVQPRWGVQNEHWLMVMPPEMEEAQLQPERWSPPTEWELDWLQGLRVMRSVHPRDPNSPPPVHRYHSAWRFPTELGTSSGPSLVNARWNEVLAHPLEGHDPFLEVHTLNQSGTTGSWFWSSQEWPQPDDFIPVSDVTWHVTAQTPVCFAPCPARVQADHAACLPGNLPSLHGPRTLNLVAGGNWEEVTPSNDTSEDAQGRSWMRVGDSPIWALAPKRSGSTPGTANLHGTSGVSSGSGSQLSCLNPTLAPFDAQGPTTAVFQWDAHQDGDQVTAVRHGVMDPLLGVVVFQDETWTMEGRATWAWDGTSDHGQAVNPGTYVVWAQSLVDGARQSVEKCLVAVRGR